MGIKGRIITSLHADPLRRDRVGPVCPPSLGSDVVNHPRTIERPTHMALGELPHRETSSIVPCEGRLRLLSGDAGDARGGQWRCLGGERVLYLSVYGNDRYR